MTRDAGREEPSEEAGPKVLDSGAAARRVLSRRLAAMRARVGMSYDDVAKVGGRRKIERIEDGRGPWKIADIWALCKIYGASSEETDQLAELAEQIRQNKDIWDDYGDLLPGSFGMLVGLEPLASQILTWDALVVPGLLQTPATARAIFQASIPVVGRESIERLVAVRLRRQMAIAHGQASILSILDEGVLHRPIGGRQVAAEQLEHLRRQAEEPSVDIRVLPYAVGAHAALRGGFILLRFEQADEPDVTYVEGAAGARLFTKPSQVEEHARVFSSLVEQSVPIKEYTQ
jgi:hypothetical protein